MLTKGSVSTAQGQEFPLLGSTWDPGPHHTTLCKYVQPGLSETSNFTAQATRQEQGLHSWQTDSSTQANSLEESLETNSSAHLLGREDRVKGDITAFSKHWNSNSLSEQHPKHQVQYWSTQGASQSSEQH